MTKIEDLSVTTMDLSTRANKCLYYADIRSIGKLVQYSEAEILRIRNCGRATVNNIKEALAKLGLSLSEPRRPPDGH